MHTPVQTLRGIQQRLLDPPPSALPVLHQARGAVFTKRWVVELLLDLAGYEPSADLAGARAIEPACGDGAFLIPMIERLLLSCAAHGRSAKDCEDSIRAFELDAQSAFTARNAVIDLLIGNGVAHVAAVELASKWVRTADYLLEAPRLLADFVIGNPPYVRLESIPEESAALYREMYPTMTGRADLYVGFYEAALQQLRPDGVCAFICADRWMRNQYGAALRSLITERFGVEVVIEMHNTSAFEDDVDAYPAITVIRAAKRTGTIVAKAGPEFSAASAAEFGKCRAPANGLRMAHVEKWFRGTEPWPCTSPEQLTLLRKLEGSCPPLEASAKVGIGVATGNDALFITKNSTLVEPSRLLKLALGGDAPNGSLEWSGNFLVDPWGEDGLVKLDDFPRLKAYFTEHESALKRRHTAAKNVESWYRTIDRVTHSLAVKPKLYIPDIKNSLEPVLDAGETYPHHNLYWVTSDDWDLEVLGGLLLSEIAQFFVESYGVKMRGGYFRFQAQYLRRICVPPPASIRNEDSNQLREAFRARDRRKATELALAIYGVGRGELECARGY